MLITVRKKTHYQIGHWVISPSCTVYIREVSLLPCSTEKPLKHQHGLTRYAVIDCWLFLISEPLWSHSMECPFTKSPPSFPRYPQLRSHLSPFSLFRLPLYSSHLVFSDRSPEMKSCRSGPSSPSGSLFLSALSAEDLAAVVILLV